MAEELFTLKTLNSSSLDSNILEDPSNFADPVVSTEVEVDPLVQACQNGDLQTVKTLVTHENINNGCLHHAAGLNYYSIVDFLISKSANVNLRIQPANATPILWAARSGHAYIVQLLLSHGANPQSKDDMGFTLLHLAVQSSNILLVIYAIHLGLPIDVYDNGCRTPLHWAIAQGDHLSVEALLKAGASPNLCDGDNNHPLHLAIANAQSGDVVAALLRHSADPTQVLNTLEMPLPEPWTLGCKLAFKSLNGGPLVYKFGSSTARLITTAIPPFALITLLNLPSFTGNVGWTIIISIALLYSLKKLIGYLMPIGWPVMRPSIESTAMSSFFVSLFAIIVYYWLFNIAHASPAAFITLLLIIVISTSYYLTLKTSPGCIEPRSREARLESMEKLMQLGLFDSVHFCTNTYVVIPQRAAYDHYLRKVVCKYDHYCPWVYNAIGLKNHRQFVLFLTSLSLGLLFMAHEVWQTSNKTTFLKLLSVITAIQALWIFLLTGVQLFQISKGTTSYEISHSTALEVYRTDPIKSFSSLPKDHPRALAIFSSSKARLNSVKAECSHKSKSKFTLLLKLVGVHQFQELKRRFKDSAWIKTDFGRTVNCLDFWKSGGGCLDSQLVGYLDNQPVDYTAVTQPLAV